MKIIYFSWVKKNLGISEEKIKPPKNIKSIKLLIEWLSSKNYKYEKVFLYYQALVPKPIIALVAISLGIKEIILAAFVKEISVSHIGIMK